MALLDQSIEVGFYVYTVFRFPSCPALSDIGCVEIRETVAVKYSLDWIPLSPWETSHDATFRHFQEFTGWRALG